MDLEILNEKEAIIIWPLTIFLYGPQTSGKTTALLHLIQKDQGHDIAFSAEAPTALDNGEIMADCTAPLPKDWDSSNLKDFQKHCELAVKHPKDLRHIIVDGVQYLSIAEVQKLYQTFRATFPQVPIVFAGCLYYLSDHDNPNQIIPTSKYLLKHCSQRQPVQRKCEFCQRLATHLWVKSLQTQESKLVKVSDPHLVCDEHFRKLLKR